MVSNLHRVTLCGCMRLQVSMSCNWDVNMLIKELFGDGRLVSCTNKSYDVKLEHIQNDVHSQLKVYVINKVEPMLRQNMIPPSALLTGPTTCCGCSGMPHSCRTSLTICVHSYTHSTMRPEQAVCRCSEYVPLTVCYMACLLSAHEHCFQQ